MKPKQGVKIFLSSSKPSEREKNRRNKITNHFHGKTQTAFRKKRNQKNFVAARKFFRSHAKTKKFTRHVFGHCKYKNFGV